MMILVLVCAAVGFLIGGWAGAAWGILVAVAFPFVAAFFDVPKAGTPAAPAPAPYKGPYKSWPDFLLELGVGLVVTVSIIVSVAWVLS